MFALNALLFDVPWLLGHRTDLIEKFDGIMMPLLFLGHLLARHYIYWIVDQESIFEYRLWKRKIIPLSNILRVSGSQYWNGRPTHLRIDYCRPDAPSTHGKLGANPADVYGFLNALRWSAPFAAIDV